MTVRPLLQALAPPPVLEGLDGLVGGDLVATPAPHGRRLVVAFCGPYELQLVVDDQLVGRHPRGLDRRALIFVSRRLPALFASLEQTFSLVLDELRPGHYAAVDLYHREEGCYLAHGELLNRIARLELHPAPFAAVEPPRAAAELARTLGRLGALGDTLEVRREEDGIVVARARLERAPEGRVR